MEDETKPDGKEFWGSMPVADMIQGIPMEDEFKLPPKIQEAFDAGAAEALALINKEARAKIAKLQSEQEQADHIKLQEEWMKSMQDERDNQLIEKLITRMKEERFLRGPEPCPEGFVEFETGGEPLVEWVEIDVKPGQTLKEAATENAELQNMLQQAEFHRGGLSDLAMNACKDSIREGHKVLELMREEARKEACVPEPTPPYIQNMYKMPSDDLKMRGMTQEEMSKMRYDCRSAYQMTHKTGAEFKQKGSDYFTPNTDTLNDAILEINRLSEQAEVRSTKIKSDLSEFEKTDLHHFKEFVAREWKAAKELWKRWRSK